MSSSTLPRIAPPAPPKVMKNRTVKVGDELWEEAQARAKRDGVDLSYVVRHYLAEYAGHGAGDA